MKKKVLVIALAVVLLAVMVGSSLAYFTDTDQVTNTFTVGSVLIDIYENGTITDKDVIEFKEPMLPVVDKTKLSNDPGYFEKVIKVESNGENAAYIRTLIAIPKNLVDYLILDLNKDDSWSLVASYEVKAEDDLIYTVYAYDHLAPVAPKDDNGASGFTSELLKGVYLDSSVDIKDNPVTDTGDLEFCKPNGQGGYTFSGFTAHEKVDGGYKTKTISVLVAAQAIQAQGFSNATTALNTGFPVGTNPWGTATLNP